MAPFSLFWMRRPPVVEGGPRGSHVVAVSSGCTSASHINVMPYRARSWRRFAERLVSACVLLRVANAHGQAVDDRAARAYDRGASAYEGGNYEGALVALLQADEFSPHDTTLELALKAALRANSAVLAMRAVQRAEERGLLFDGLAQRVRSQFERRVGSVRVWCSKCTANVDGVDIAPGAVEYLSPGTHGVLVEQRSMRRRYRVEIEPGQLVELRVDAAMAEPRRARSSASGRDDSGHVAPTWGYIAIGVTSALAIGTTLSALDTRARHQEFERTPNAQTSDAGERSQLRTNVLAGATLLAAGATAVLNLVFVRWHSPPPTTGAVRRPESSRSY